jgi:HEAT repeat protein
LSLAEAAATADGLAQQGAERELAQLRSEWAEEVESAVRSSDYRARVVAYRAIGQFRFRQKLALLRRGLEDESPACRGSALLSLELLSRDHPGAVNADRSLLHAIVSDGEENKAVRRLAVVCLKNGSPQRDTITILQGLAADDDEDRELRAAAKRVAELLKKKSR